MKSEQIVSIILAIACLITIVLVGVLSNLLKETNEENARYSFSRFQLWIWSIVICPAFSLNWGFVNPTLPKINLTTLLLLSISLSVSLTSALVASMQKVGKFDLKKENFFKDILTDDTGQVSIGRLQQFIFTMIYLCVYLTYFFSHNMNYPDFDKTAFVLMGISTGSYVLAKSLNK